MDVSTLFGMMASFVIIIVAILVSGDISSFFSLSSFLIVVGCTFAACIASYPISKIKSLWKIVKNAFYSTTYDIELTIEQFCKLSYIAKKEGLLAMESFVSHIDDDFMKKGVLLIVDGTDPEMIKKILELEVENMLDRHAEGEGILRTLGKYSPAFGMIGTLIGLINMLKNLSDVNTLGPSMGVALITTFYGSLLANALFLPLAGKLKFKSENEAKFMIMIIDGIVSVQEGDSPLVIKEKLKTYMEQKSRNYKKEEDNNENKEK